MPLNFPSSPSANTNYTFSGKTWTYNGNAWALVSSTLSTSVVPEGSNLYFSNARATAAVINSSLSNVTVSGNVIAGNVNVASGGVIKFADGTSQNTAASTAGTLLTIFTRASNIGVTLQNRILSVQGRASNVNVSVA
jgi:hypothetical protein